MVATRATTADDITATPGSNPTETPTLSEVEHNDLNHILDVIIGMPYAARIRSAFDIAYIDVVEALIYQTSSNLDALTFVHNDVTKQLPRCDIAILVAFQQFAFQIMGRDATVHTVWETLMYRASSCIVKAPLEVVMEPLPWHHHQL